ncbi:MAG: fumarylacetoacetate hydrolase family protein, partial [Verrucomicrobia bacterium]|nr:fumarylacetoacetate hydrolase family protein [Verrucomicrobiota bacterium]
PIGSQEVWGAGVTYEISREARFEESKETDAGRFYRNVYTAERPELFFKSSSFRVVGTGGKIRVRRDAHWSVPEPELTLVINREGQVAGYTIGNDVCSRDIEGENPLYLPQGKVYNGSCAIGPGILIYEEPLDNSIAIEIVIHRNGAAHFTGATTIGKMKRTFATLIEYLYRELQFPTGAYLMTGTGIVPPNEFTLEPGDKVAITIQPIGTLINEVE